MLSEPLTGGGGASNGGRVHITQTTKPGAVENGTTQLHHQPLRRTSQTTARRRPPCFRVPLFDRIPARYVLYFLSWSGFLVSFMMRNDINFALVAMVRSPSAAGVGLAPATTNLTAVNGTDGVTTQLTPAAANHHLDGDFDWSSEVQSIILSSFYWCYVLSQVAGGVATQYFGTKRVFGWSQLATALCSLCIPWAADTHYTLLILLRSVQGFASGLTWPAMYAIVSQWIPPAERSRFMSSFQGFSIGIGLTYPMCGYIIANFGWRPVFYTTGTIGCLWCVMWWLLAFDTPQQHPRIGGAELKYIELSVGKEVRNAGAGQRVPWLRIFCSLPVWSIGVTTFGRIWVHYTFIMSGPVYMKNILHFSIEENGLLSGLPFLCSYVSSVFFCWAADWLVVSGRMRQTAVRKLFTALSQIVPGVLCVAIGVMGQEQDIVAVLVIWFVAVTMITASYAGAMACIVDVAPNLAGPVLAFAQTIHMTASFVSPVVSGLIVKDATSIEQWRIVFALAAIVATCTYITFQVYGTSDIQPWNYPSPAHRARSATTDSNGGSEADTVAATASVDDDDDDDDDEDGNSIGHDRATKTTTEQSKSAVWVANESSAMLSDKNDGTKVM